MGLKLSTESSSMQNTPVVNIRGEKNSYFVGTLALHKQTKSQYKNEDGSEKMQDIYEFTIEDTDMELVVKQGKEYVPAEVAAGATVSVFAPTRLNNALRQASVGQRLKITYLGLGKAAKRGGKPHEYDVEIL